MEKGRAELCLRPADRIRAVPPAASAPLPTTVGMKHTHSASPSPTGMRHTPSPAPAEMNQKLSLGVNQTPSPSLAGNKQSLSSSAARLEVALGAVAVNGELTPIQQQQLWLAKLLEEDAMSVTSCDTTLEAHEDNGKHGRVAQLMGLLSRRLPSLSRRPSRISTSELTEEHLRAAALVEGLVAESMGEQGSKVSRRDEPLLSLCHRVWVRW